MSKRKTKSLGPANDRGVPRDELILARLIQNAAARGLKSCRGAYYKNEDDVDVCARDATRCCAMGAAMLTPKLCPPTAIIIGNDAKGNNPTPEIADDKWLSAYTIGAAFYEALSD